MQIMNRLQHATVKYCCILCKVDAEGVQALRLSEADVQQVMQRKNNDAPTSAEEPVDQKQKKQTHQNNNAPTETCTQATAAAQEPVSTNQE